MNFVGHAMVARWEHDRAAYAFGAMLPDLQRMCGARVEHADDRWTAAGIECHHRVDRAFHDTPTFVRLNAEARVDLRGRGLPRPVVLGAAHVGVELLLDGVFVDEPNVVDDYLAAIADGRQRAANLRWSSEDAAGRLQHVCDRIGQRPAVTGYRDPEVVADRLVAIFSRRPRLTAAAEHRDALAAWAADARPSVVLSAATLRQELRAALP